MICKSLVFLWSMTICVGSQHCSMFSQEKVLLASFLIVHTFIGATAGWVA
jgi:hypothetical protein